ncbi:MAG: hypothetical protein ABR562_01050 [Thermoplasmatota archaeon]
MANIPKPATISAALAVGTCGIGALLANQAGQTNLLYAFGLAAVFVLASLMFAKGEAQKKEAA